MPNLVVPNVPYNCIADPKPPIHRSNDVPVRNPYIVAKTTLINRDNNNNLQISFL